MATATLTLPSAQTVRDALLAAGARLRGHGVETPLLDATVLLAHTLGISKERLFAAYPEHVPAAERDRFQDLVAARAAGAPVAYLRGYKEFYGRRFLVDGQVLIPRPETELLCEAALACGDAVVGAPTGAQPGAPPGALAGAPAGGPERPLAVHEVGTGSGAVAITLQLERPAWRVSASDLSPAAVAAAARNCDRLGAAIPLTVCDLLPAGEPVQQPASAAASAAPVVPQPAAVPGQPAAPAPVAAPGLRAVPAPAAVPGQPAAPAPVAAPGLRAVPAPAAVPGQPAVPAPVAAPGLRAVPAPAAAPGQAAVPAPVAAPGLRAVPAPAVAPGLPVASRSAVVPPAAAPGRWDLIVANLPYLTTAEVVELQRRGWTEPTVALDGSSDGLGPTRRLIRRARGRLRAGGTLLLETAAARAEALAHELERLGYAPPTVLNDLAGLPRVVVARWPN